MIDVSNTSLDVDLQGLPLSGGEDMMLEAMMPWVQTGSLFINIFMVVAFLLKAWGLYNINTKLGEPHPWLSWVPVVQVYSFVKAGGKDGIWVLWLILGFIAFIIPGIVIAIIISHGISKRTGRGVWSTLGIIFFDFIMLPVIGYKLEAGEKTKETSAKETSAKETKTSEVEEL